MAALDEKRRFAWNFLAPVYEPDGGPVGGRIDQLFAGRRVRYLRPSCLPEPDPTAAAHRADDGALHAPGRARSQTVSESSSRASPVPLLGVQHPRRARLHRPDLGGRRARSRYSRSPCCPPFMSLGLFTFVRLVQSVAEDFQYGRAINRIRHHYVELAGDQAHLFMMSAHDDAVGVLANMGITHSTWQAYFTTPSMVAVINSVVGGSAVAIAVGAIAGPPLGVAAGIGALVAVISVSGDAPLRDPLSAGRGRRTRDSLSDP